MFLQQGYNKNKKHPCKYNCNRRTPECKRTCAEFLKYEHARLETNYKYAKVFKEVYDRGIHYS